MSLANLDGGIMCNEHHFQTISHVDINNFSSKKLLCPKCIRQNRLIDDSDAVTFQQFTDCLKIIENSFWGLSDSQLSKDDVLKVFNGISYTEKQASLLKESCAMTQQYRVKIFGQIQETCDLFIKNMQEQINTFRQELQESLKHMLSNYFSTVVNNTDQAKVAGVVVKAIEENKQYSEVEDLIKQLHSGKLELKFILEGFSSTQAQIKSTLQSLLDSQKKVFESSRAALNQIIPPSSEVINTIQNNESKHDIQRGNLGNITPTIVESPLKFMRLNQLKQQGNGYINGSPSLINTKLCGPMSPLKVVNQNQTHQNNTNSSTFSNVNKSTQFLKGNCQQRQFFKERFITSLNTINTICDKRTVTLQATTPRQRDNGVDSLSKIPNEIDSLSEIRNYTTNNLSHINEQNDSLLQINKSTARETSENKINREEKRALIESLYYKNNNTSHEGLTFKPSDVNKERPPSSDKNVAYSNGRVQLQLNLKTINSSKSQPNFLSHTHTNSLLSLISPPKQKAAEASKSESSSPSANFTICKSESSKQNLTCALRMDNNTLIAGTSDGYLIACDISKAQSASAGILDIQFKEKIRAHKSISHLSQCPCNHAIFFSVGSFKENSSSIKLWTLGNNYHLTEVAELRDFHPAPIDEIIVLKEELTKDLQLMNKNAKEKQGIQDEKEIEIANQSKSLLTVITLATLSKGDSLKIWKITYKNGSLQNGVVLKLVDIPLKNLSIKSHLYCIENKLYLSNANRVFCYEFNDDFTTISKESFIDLFLEQSDFIQFINASNNCLGVISKKFQFVVLSDDLKQKRPPTNFIKQLQQSNKQLEADKVFISNLIPLHQDHFGIGYRYDKSGYKVAIINGVTHKIKQTIESFENSVSFVLGRNIDQKIILIEASKVIKIQKPWVNSNKMNISFQKQN